MLALQGGKSLQIAESRSRPTHTRPPNAGAGFPHDLLRYRLPTSQVFEQGPHSDQDVHCPSCVQFVTFNQKLKYVYNALIYILIHYDQMNLTILLN